MELIKILQKQGFGSRRQCEQNIRQGNVKVRGEIILSPKTDFSLEDLSFEVAGERWDYREKAYLLLNKPAGYECSHQPVFHPSVFQLLPRPLIERGVQCVGRLDQDTTGLLLFSDDGQFIHTHSSGKKGIPKTYRVGLSDSPTEAFLSALLGGVTLNDEPASVAATRCIVLDDRTIEMTITTGKYHQVKRMIAAAGNHVATLERVAIAGLKLEPGLKLGQWRWLTPPDFDLLGAY